LLFFDFEYYVPAMNIPARSFIGPDERQEYSWQEYSNTQRDGRGVVINPPSAGTSPSGLT